jgi:hypothetical protein
MRGQTPLLVAALALGLACAGFGFHQAALADTNRGDVPASHPLPLPTPDKLVLPTPISSPMGAEPSRLRIPTLGVDAPIVSVSVHAGELGVPDNPHMVGWWERGALAGALQGTVVLDGHVDTVADGPGALFHLADLQVDTPLTLSTPDRQFDYVVRAVRRYPKTGLPEDIFNTSGLPRLSIITCGGFFNRITRQYADNIVVFATPR